MERSRARMISLRRRTPKFYFHELPDDSQGKFQSTVTASRLILSNAMPTISKTKLIAPMTADGDGTYSSLLEHQNQWLSESCSTSSTAAPQQHQNSQAPSARLAAPRLCNPSYLHSNELLPCVLCGLWTRVRCRPAQQTSSPVLHPTQRLRWLACVFVAK